MVVLAFSENRYQEYQPTKKPYQKHWEGEIDMTKLQEMSEAFKFQYEKFLQGCDALEEKGEWSVSADGDMEGYYFNDIMCVIVTLISADGEFSEDEAKYVNDIFGFRYSPEELKELWKTNGSDINQMIEEEIPAGYRKMKAISEKLAGHYKEMLFRICDIIAESDGILRASETRQIDRIKKSLAD